MVARVVTAQLHALTTRRPLRPVSCAAARADRGLLATFNVGRASERAAQGRREGYRIVPKPCFGNSTPSAGFLEATLAFPTPGLRLSRTAHILWPVPESIQRSTLMALVSGQRLGPYEIVSPIAAGGMGEVYRARD